MLFPLESWAAACREFMLRRDPSIESVRLVHYMISPESNLSPTSNRPFMLNGTKAPEKALEQESGDLHIVLFPPNAFSIAKQFWQHTGLGISSRLAEHCLELLSKEERNKIATPAISPITISPAGDISAAIQTKLPRNRHYRAKSVKSAVLEVRGTPEEDKVNGEIAATYVEERYARNLPISAAAEAKRTLRTRIAGVLVRNDKLCNGERNGALQGSESIDSAGGCRVQPSTAGKFSGAGSTRRAPALTEDDVFLFPTGMSAIWHAHQLALRSFGEKKSVCFGSVVRFRRYRFLTSVHSFPYVDSLKILEKWGPGVHFFGHGSDADIDALERLLASSNSAQDLNSTGDHQSPSSPIIALFCEFPSNPLLRSPNLKRLRTLADEYNFVIVVDETVGSFVNVHVLPYVDMMATSLTKIFSGDTNVMGGG
jgi:cystathionine gamma-synthase